MASQVDICNLALSRFGQGSINALNEQSESARLLSLNYASCLDATLRAFPWNFSTKVAALALTANTEPGWEYVYQYPSECVNIRRIYAEGDARSHTKTEFKIFTNSNEKWVACDVAQAYAEYTWRITNPALYDAQFTEALSYKLAAEVCLPLSGNSQKANEMLQKFQFILASAQHINAVENQVPPELPTSYTKARR